MPHTPLTPAHPTSHPAPAVELRPLPWHYLLLGVILPLATLVVEATTHMCAADFFDPLRTPVHFLWVAEVPLVLGWVWMVSRGKARPSPRLQAVLTGMVLMTCVFYAVLFLPVMPLALFALIMGIGILPISPSLALWMAVRAALSTHRMGAPTRLFAVGAGLSLAGLLGADVPQVYTRWALSRAVSEDPVVALDGVRMLRRYHDRELLLRHAYQRNAGAKDIFSMALGLNRFVTPERAREVYFRVTGEAFNARPAPTWTGHHRWENDDWAWDVDQSGSNVGGHLKGLTLAGSRLDVSADPDAGLAYTEWTMEFHNASQQQREARGEILLPPGSVVSRATLWVDGVERDAAVASTGDARKAYQSVVRTRRDPLLVTQASPDRVLVQCFPVPVDGRMKIRVGITTALSMEGNTQAAYFLPQWQQRNFAFAPDLKTAAWVESRHALTAPAPWNVTSSSARAQLTPEQLQDPASVLHLSRDVSVATAWTADPVTAGQVVQASLSTETVTPPTSVALVLDGSASMASHARGLARALEEIPEGTRVMVVLAADTTRVLLPMTPWNAQVRTRLQETLAATTFEGGQDNRDALLMAAESLDRDHGVLLWVHGAQVMDTVTGALDQFLERTSSQLTLVDVQTVPGPNRLMETLSRHLNVRSQRNAVTIDPTLTQVFSAMHGNHPRWTLKPTASSGTGHATSSHLARLWANQEVLRMHRSAPDARAHALQLAVAHRLVTPVSGMVVLETAAQEQAQGLTPADPSQVPAVPEPGVILLMAVVLAMMGMWTVRQRRRA